MTEANAGATLYQGVGFAPVLAIIAALWALPTAATAQGCQAFHCACTDTDYDDIGSCQGACHVSLGCFVGICTPVDRQGAYDEASRMLDAAMTMLEAYADQTLLDLAKAQGLDGAAYDAAVSNLASKLDAGGWDWTTASDADVSDLFSSRPTPPGQRDPKVGMSTNMSDCSITVVGSFQPPAQGAGLTHEGVHRARCLAQNGCGAASGTGPAACSDPDAYSDWSRDPEHWSQDEREAYCAQVQDLLAWLQARPDCAADGGASLAAIQARAAALCGGP